MENSRKGTFLSRCALAAAAVACVSLKGADLTWDADGAGSAALGGTGTWNLLDPLWDNAGTLQAWTSADSAIFGGTAGTVTLDEAVTAQNLTFSVDGYTLTGSTLTLGGGITANGSATLSSGITLGAASAWSVADAKTLTVGGVVGGGFALTKSGAGTLVLNAANTFSGGVTLSGGFITLGNNAGLGTGTLTFAGGTLQTNGSARVVANNLSFQASTSSGLVGSPVGDLLYTGTATGSGTAVLNSAVSRSVWLQGDWSGFTGTLSLTSYTDGTNYRLGGTPGSTTSNESTNASNLSQAKVVLAGTPTNRALIWNGVAGATVRLGELSGAGGRIDTSGGRAANWEVGSLGTSTTFGGVIAGTGTSLTKVGVGTLTLSGVNTYTGRTIINGGEVVIGAESGLGATPGSYVANQLTLDNGALVVTAGMTLSANRGITLGSGGAWLRSTALSGGTAYSIDAKITGTGQLNIFAHGNTSDTGGGVGGNLYLGNAGNDFTGNVVIKSGVVSFNGDGAFGNAANTITIEGGGLVATGNRTLASTRSVVLSGGGDKIFRVYGSSTLTVNGAISGTGNVRHTDGGTLALAGANNFTGNLVNAAGTLAISAAQAYTGYLLVSNASSTLRLDADNVLPDARTVLLYGQTTFNVNGKTDTVGSLSTGSSGDSTATVNLGAAGSTGTLTVTSNSLPSGMTSGYSEATVHAKITGSGNLAYANTGSPTAVWNISNTANDFVGNVVVTAGRIRFQADGALGNAANDLVFNGDAVASWNNGDGRASLQVTNGTNLTLTSGRSIILNSGKEGTMYVWGGTTTTVEGQVTGAGGLRKEDSGVLLLGNATNNWSGHLNVVVGEVRIGAAGALSPASYVYVRSGTLNLNGFSSSALGVSNDSGGVINLGSGGATLTSTGNLKPSIFGDQSLLGKVTGTGNLAYNHASSSTAHWDVTATTNDFVGTVTITRGRMRFASNATLGNLENDLVFNGDPVTTWGNGEGRASVQVTSSADLTFSVGRSVTLNAGKQGTFYVWGTRTHTVEGQVTGAGGLRKEDDGTLLLTNTSNNWTGDTRVVQGTLRVGAAGALSTGTTLLIGGAGTVNLNALESSVVGLASEGQTSGNLSGGGRLTVTGAGSYDYSGLVTGGTTVRQSGTGTQTLSGTGDNSNAWAEVTSGTLVLAKASSASVHVIGRTDDVGLWVTGGVARLGGTGGDQIFEKTDVSVTGGVLDLNARSEGFRGLTGGGGAVRNDGGSAATLTLGQTAVSGVSHTYSGSVGVGGASALNLAKVGAGAQTLSGSLDLGAVTVSGGTLTLAGAGTHGAGVSVASGATLVLDVAAEHTLGGVLSGSGTLTKSGAGLLLLGTSGTFSGTFSVAAGTARLTADNALGTGGISVASGATLDLNGRLFSNVLTLAQGAILTGSGTLAAGSGTLDVSTIEIPSGVTLAVSSGGTLSFGSRSYAGDVAYSGGSVTGANFTGNLVVTGTGVQLGNGIAAGTVKLGAGASASIGSGFARDILFEGGALGGLSTAGYTGTITVGANSTLDVDGALPIDTVYGDIQVQSGSTLKGGATFMGSVSVSGNLAPGNSPGEMIYQSGLALGSSSVTEWEFTTAVEGYVDAFELQVGRGADYDALTVEGGTLAIAAGAQLAIAAPAGYAYDAEFWASTRLFQFAAIGETASITGQFVFANQTTQLTLDAGRWNILGTDGVDPGVYLQWTPVPEPSTYGIILGALALAGAAVRRRYGTKAERLNRLPA